MNNTNFEATAKKVDGVDMVFIKVGSEELQFTIDEAYAFAEHIQNVAGQTAFEEGLDDLLSWGSDGGTS